jgi:predicted ATP-grasp superfamily ATP-dependent carboligase
MRVFVYEHLTAIGVGREPGSPEHSLYREGRAMRDALAADFRQLGGVEVVTFPEEAGACSPQAMVVFATGSDWTVVIAPELDGILVERVEDLREAGCRVLAPSGDAIALTSDKLALAEHWRGHGVPTPATTEREPTGCEAFPVVWKPRHGAGSTSTFLLRSTFDLARVRQRLAAEEQGGPMILQEFIPGRAASVAFLCGPAGNVPLLPAFQLLSDDGRFKYHGGELPIPDDLAGRAVRLAQRAVDCVPGLAGYVGVDLVLGDAADGSRDFAIEINPRLTTSYVGLRALADFNLAGAMLQAAEGTLTRPPEWKPGRVRFGTEGSARPA